jgi:hypothetical protein
MPQNQKPYVIGGPQPTGKLPGNVGEGIFGYANDTEGIFGSHLWPADAEGVFFNPYARSTQEMQRPDTAWMLQRRPGRPLYPGSDASGIVLLGPSMGSNGEPRRSGLGGTLLIGGVLALGAWYLYKLMAEGA